MTDRANKMADKPITKVAVLGTLAEFHREAIRYNLPALIDLVSEIDPDFLCLDMTAEQWQARRFEELPPEYREGLLPLAKQTDIVVVPIAGSQPPPMPGSTGLAGRLIDWLRGSLAYLQRTAPGPDAINQGWRHEVANLLYQLTGALAGRELTRAWREHTHQLTEQVLEVTRRDPGRRVLVVVNVQHCHHIRARLRGHPDLQVDSYTDL